MANKVEKAGRAITGCGCLMVLAGVGIMALVAVLGVLALAV
jgi:hypothetical protein